MSNLKGFLKPAYNENVIEVEISDRFTDDNGVPLKFKMHSLSNEQIKSLQKRSIKTKKVQNKTVQEVDTDEFIDRCIVEACIQPDFKDPELCKAYNCEDPIALVSKMLLFGEHEKLGRAFIHVNGMDPDSLNEIGEVTKN